LHALDLHLEIGLARVRGSILSLTLDAFNLTDAELEVPNRALLLVDDDGSLGEDAGGRIALPTEVNPTFGQSSGAFGTGRMLRIGARLGLAR